MARIAKHFETFDQARKYELNSILLYTVSEMLETKYKVGEFTFDPAIDHLTNRPIYTGSTLKKILYEKERTTASN